jgi:hypothetical protein
VLDASELSKSVPGTATAPALCGRLVGVQNAAAGRPSSYTASLVVNAALSSPVGAYICHIGGFTAPVQDSERRRASA